MLRDYTTLERNWLADLVGDLSQAPKSEWASIVVKYERMSSIQFFVEPDVSVGFGRKIYGHTIGVHGTYPRCWKGVEDRRQNNYSPMEERVSIGSSGF